MTVVVVDANIVLDVLVFDDPASAPLKAALAAGGLTWIATQAMRDELARVLDYPQVAPRVAFYRLTNEAVLARFDAAVSLQGPAPKASVSCRDPDDQIFIDLAVAHRAQLLSKDKAVLALRKRLAALGVVAARALA